MYSKFLKIQFVTRKKKRVADASYLYVRVTYKGKRFESSLNQSISSKVWDEQRSRCRGTSDEIQSVNGIIEKTNFRIQQIVHELDRQEEPITITQIKNKFLGIEEEPKTLLSLVSYHNEVMRDKLREGTLKNYRSTLKCLQQYLMDKLNRVDLPLKSLDYQFALGYEKYLKEYKPNTRVKCTNNGAMKHIERLKKLSKFALRLGWIKEDKLVDVKLEFHKTERHYLSDKEIASFIEAQFTSSSLNVVRDLFLFSCYTGLAYSDMVELNKNHIKIMDGDKQWIYTKRIKTDEPLRIPLLPQAIEIINKYKNVEYNGTKLFPLFTNQMMNRSLKIICKELKIHKKITFHSARHTFATTITLSNGMPIETVSKLLGHTKIRTTQIYARVLENKVGADMEALAARL